MRTTIHPPALYLIHLHTTPAHTQKHTHTELTITETDPQSREHKHAAQTTWR